jgi:hypothetical protein
MRKLDVRNPFSHPRPRVQPQGLFVGAGKFLILITDEKKTAAI